MLLAAGAGRRFGGPKALVRTDGVPWVVSTLDRMRVAGCDPLLVVTGAAGERVAELLPAAVQVVPNPDWQSGMGSSLRVGLEAATALDVETVLVMLVDLPGVTADMMAVLMSTVADDDPQQVLARADFGGRAGHPVLLGRAHWALIGASAGGDDGARGYLRDRPTRLVALGSAAQGADCDTPADHNEHKDEWSRRPD